MCDVQALSSSGIVLTTSKDQTPSKDTSSRVAVDFGRSIVMCRIGVIVWTSEMAHQVSTYVMYVASDPRERKSTYASEVETTIHQSFLGAIGIDCRTHMPRMRDVLISRLILDDLLMFRPLGRCVGRSIARHLRR
jgi:hypothetical protein